jgi:subfamily B ATP-binding cassette protein MsbA
MALYRRLLGYVWPHKAVFLLSVAGMAVVAMSEVGFAALLKPIMDGGFVERDDTMIRLIPALLMGVFMARAVGAFTDQYCIAWVGRRLIFDLRQLLFGRMIRLPSAYYDLQPTSGLISKLIYDLEQVAAASTMAVQIIIKDSLLTLGLVAWMLILSWPLTLIFLLITPFVAFVIRKASRRFRRSSEGIQQSMGGITHVAKEAFQGHRVVKAFGGYAVEEGTFRAVNEANRRRSLRRALVAAISVPLLLLIAGAGVSLIIYLALTDTIGAFVSPGTFVSYMGTILLLMSPIKRLARINEYVQAGLAAANSVFSVIDEPSEDIGESNPPRKVLGRVEFQNVAFTYPQGDQPALRGVSFVLEPGKTVALVGASGSGKSTIASLLLGFYTPNNGEILIDGIPIESYSLTDLRRQVSLVPQEPILFDGTIAQNVTYAESGQPQIDLQRLLEATGVDKFSNDGKQGVGELGMRLSGGQRQRVSLARALYRPGVILVLDEATSALDVLSEQGIKASLEQFSSQRSVLIIAHRLSFITHADQIHVFEDGRIKESGRHETLLDRNGSYARMWRVQQAEDELHTDTLRQPLS